MMMYDVYCKIGDRVRYVDTVDTKEDVIKCYKKEIEYDKKTEKMFRDMDPSYEAPKREIRDGKLFIERTNDDGSVTVTEYYAVENNN